MDQPRVEQLATPDSMSAVKADIVRALNSGPNIQAEVDPVVQKIVVKPWERVAGQEQEDITKLTAILREELGQNHFGFPQHQVRLSEIMGQYPNPLIDAMFQRNNVRALIGARSMRNGGEACRVGDGDYREDSASKKGIPPEVSSAIAFATSSWLAREVDQSCKTEAERIYQAQTAIIDNQARALVASQIPECQAIIEQVKAEKGERDRVYGEEAKNVQVLDEQGEKIVQFSKELSGNIPQDRQDDFIHNLPGALQILREKGLLVKHTEVSPDGFAKLDNLLVEMLGDTSPLTNSLGAFGIKSLDETMRTSVKVAIENYMRKGGVSNYDLFTRVSGVFRGLVGGRVSLEELLKGQERLFVKFNNDSRNQQAAKDFVVDLTTRAALLSLFKNGSISQELPVEISRLNVTDLLRNSLRQQQNYRSAQEKLRPIRVAKEEVDRKLQDEENRLSSLERQREDYRRQLEDRERLKAREVEEIKLQLLKKLLVDDRGQEPPEPRWREALWGIVFDSALFKEIVQAVFVGLPYLEPSDPQSYDFLPQLVGAILPENHPTAALASQFISDQLRRYAANEHVLRSAGFSSSSGDQDYRRAQGKRGQVAALIKELEEGARIVEIPPEVQRLDSNAIKKALDEKNAKVRTALIEASNRALGVFLRNLGWSDYDLVSGYMLQHPSLNDSGFISLPKNEFENSGISSQFPFVTDYDSRPFYVIEQKSKRDTRWS